MEQRVIQHRDNFTVFPDISVRKNVPVTDGKILYPAVDSICAEYGAG
jgi:hypothetical protein